MFLTLLFETKEKNFVNSELFLQLLYTFQRILCIRQERLNTNLDSMPFLGFRSDVNWISLLPGCDAAPLKIWFPTIRGVIFFLQISKCQPSPSNIADEATHYDTLPANPHSAIADRLALCP
jgi:hypothetical protein